MQRREVFLQEEVRILLIPLTFVLDTFCRPCWVVVLKTLRSFLLRVPFPTCMLILIGPRSSVGVALGFSPIAATPALACGDARTPQVKMTMATGMTRHAFMPIEARGFSAP
ncbi:hypothetical protein Ssi03_32790 [Sphaerisporangium siamense]|nr:hypothetical protein Ssi03_32790 [Sphaerisporangium siamense]